jgi:hypothetical protein
MNIKVGNDYIEFEDDIEIERQVKLFEDVSTINGDFSYSFEIPKTQHNVSIIRVFVPDDVYKPWNYKIPASIENNGQQIYSGFIRVEVNGKHEYRASFFSGNSNWFDLLNLPLRNSFTWTQYDLNYTTNNIRDSWTTLDRNAITFPMLDRGGLDTRRSFSFWLEDFQPFIFVKNIVQTITNQTGIKITGDLIKDPRYAQLVTSNNGRSGIEQRVEDRTVKVGLASPQTATGATYSKINFTVTSGQFFNSTNGNWNTAQSRYIVDADLREWSVNVSLNFSRKSYYTIRILKNGTETIQIQTLRNVSSTTFTKTYTTPLAAGDYIELQFKMNVSIFTNGAVLTSSSFGVSPTKFKKVFADQLLPDLTASEFLSNIFRLFNCLVTYNPQAGEIKTLMFENILKQPEIDISNYVELQEENYEEFISDYAKRNLLLWKDQSNDEVDEYNEINEIPFGGGVIEIDNDFLEDEATLLEMDFVAAFQRGYPNIGVSFPNLKYVEIVETDEDDTFPTVSDNGDGKARFNASGFFDTTYTNLLVRVSNSTVESYNGDYRIESVDAGGNYVILQDAYYEGTASGTITVLDWEDQNNEEQVLLIQSAQDTPLIDFTGTDVGWLEFGTPLINGNISNVTTAYMFPNKNLRGSLVFQDNLQNDWNLTTGLLNSGVKQMATGNLPSKIYNDIDFLRPLRVKSGKVNALFYPNRITGYKREEVACDIELIKLSRNGNG